MSDFPVPSTTFNLNNDLAGRDGWSRSRPPGITWTQWPRSPISGLPMKHLFTVRVPESYRVQGPGLVALALFQDDYMPDRVDGLAEVLAGGPAPVEDPFWKAVAAYVASRHPTEHFTMDEAGIDWASIWLTAEEFAAPRCEIPAPNDLPRFESDRLLQPEGEDRPDPLRLEECHVDPNAGRPATTEYDEDEEWEPEPCHFGGTVAYYNGFSTNPATGEYESGPWGISPWYLEFTESLSGANLGGGSGLFDLRTGQMDSSS